MVAILYLFSGRLTQLLGIHPRLAGQHKTTQRRPSLANMGIRRLHGGSRLPIPATDATFVHPPRRR
jgi:hypothetical protein